MTPQRFTAPRLLAVVGAAMIALGGCANNPSSAGPSASPSVDRVRAAWFDAAKCMRAHGYPNFPDPVQNAQGGWEMPQSPHVPSRVDVPACNALIRKAKQGSRAANQPSAQEMAKLRLYAKCMREHGVSNWPDPDSQGNFDLTPELRNAPERRTAHEACKQYAPAPRAK